MNRVGVIDVGSNTIKLLVAEKNPSGSLVPLHSATVEARISERISPSTRNLSEPSMARALAAVATLFTEAKGHRPDEVLLVATSAVRDAGNGLEFARRVQRSTGKILQVISGEREAELIGLGLMQDPALLGAKDFYLFDLGGGSLECVVFRQRKVSQSISLRLGCVRLTQTCVEDPAGIFSKNDRVKIVKTVGSAFEESGFRFELPQKSLAVGTGGTVSTARMIRATRGAIGFSETSPQVTVEEMETLLKECGDLRVEDRWKIAGLSAARADILPTGLATLIEVARLAEVTEFAHSAYNLRYGFAAEFLGLG